MQIWREKGNDFEHHSEPSVDRDRGIVGCDFGGEGGGADTRSAVMVSLDAGTAGWDCIIVVGGGGGGWMDGGNLCCIIIFILKRT